MWGKLLRIAVLSLTWLAVNGIDREKLEKEFSLGLKRFMKTGIVTKELESSINQLQLPHLFRKERDTGLDPQLACTVCEVGIRMIIDARRQGKGKEEISNLIESVCVWLKIESPEVCHGVIHINADSLMYIVDMNANLTSKRFCSTLLQGFGCKDPSRQDWSIQIPPKTAVRKRKISKQSKSLKVLQLSDIHYDPEYAPGSNALCGEPMCCRAGSKPATNEAAAGFWGDYRDCDIPYHTYVATLEDILAKHKDLDYMYFTGDIINHKVWDTNIESNTKAIFDIFSKLKEMFGSIGIYPILGNHEPHPVNVFSSEGISEIHLSTQWIFNLAAEEWKHWLPADTRETILRGGYYTALVKPGFRIVALNSNVCYVFNWWLVHDDVDPFNQLQWLVEVLSEAEKNDELVHIISHIPNGDDTCLFNWAREYARIVDRFSHIITAQFNGHTHFDEMILFFSSSKPEKAINVAFNGGSLTEFSYGNPNYKVYDIDSETMKVKDIDTWIFNLTEANLTPHLPPRWYKLYSFKDAYGVSDLEPQTLAALTKHMAKHPALTKQYHRFKYREADVSMIKGCDRNCELRNLCSLVTHHPDVTVHCEELVYLYNIHRPQNKTIDV